MYLKCVLILILEYSVYFVCANDVLGCGGFIKSHVPIDFSKVEVKLVTRQGIVKDKTNCAPNNGYYFVPLYDRGELILELSPPPGWSFTPKEIHLNIDGSDPCSLGKDLNFVFDGFGITGRVESLGSIKGGPENVSVQLVSKESTRSTVTDSEGKFFFSPVFPGTYTVSISHPKWKVYKKSTEVQVAEGNSDLPGQSLIIQGFDVKGKILTVEGNPVRHTTVVLFSKIENHNIAVDNCDKNELSNIQFKSKALCHVTSNSLGEFIFPVVPYGNYFVLPYYKDQNIYFQPEKIEFRVEHTSVKLTEQFQVIGFSIPGRVTNGKNNGISSAKIYLNGQEVTRTDNFGKYKLEKLNVGKYKLRAEADDLIFEEVILNIDTYLQSLPDLVPSAFKVCGEVASDKTQIVTFSQVGSTRFVQTETNSQQQFCQFLSPGKYDVQVSVSEEDKQNGLQFFPLQQTVEVTSENILDLMFSQLKSNISGKVECIQKKDCEGLSVILISGSEKVSIPLQNSYYSASDMQPGSYEVLLSHNKFCWKTSKQIVSVNSATVEIPPFIQTGYLVNFVSSHQTKVIYKTLTQGQVLELNIQRGVTSTCLSAPGEYTFSIKSCHSYDSDTVTYNTTSNDNQITLNALKHTVALSIQSEADYGPIDLSVTLDKENKVNQKIAFLNGKYELKLMLQPGEVSIVTPYSDLLFFTPSSLEILGTSDCQDLGPKFSAVKGKVFQGIIQPPLAGVTVTVEGLTNDEVFSFETDSKGNYKFIPLDGKFEYRISAKKESYVLTGPDNRGVFKAQKLAEIVVDVLDEADKSPLGGVLLSLSGGESYRRNLQTDLNGKITFYSLSASDYFLRPMMKEYQFEPNSKIITVKEGETVRVKLTGKRVAFSAFGKITSLNDDPVENVNVVASGINNCTGYSEETTSDSAGLFRIRGLQPFCSFKVFVQINNDSDNLVERTSPNFIEVKNIDQDIQSIHIIVFRPVLITDVLVKVYAENVDHYKSLKLKLYRESDGASQLFSAYVDASNAKVDKNRNHGILIHLPSVPLDKKLYSLHLEPAYNTKAKGLIEYFTANSSFRFIELDFTVKGTTSEQPIKQTSVWAIVFIFIVLVAVYNVQMIVDLVKEHVNFNLSDLSSYIPVPSNVKTVTNYDNDIDQIVQDINNVRKNRPKKTN